MQSKKKDRGYHGAETISEQGEIVRPAEASVLVDDEERLRRFLNSAKPSRNQIQITATETTPHMTTSHKTRKRVSNDTAPKKLATPSDDSNANFKVPKWGERALLMLLKNRDRREYVVGDMQEEYADIRLRHGVKYANIWYWKQVMLSIFSLKFGPGLRRIFVALIGEWIRRKIF
jgi:hypothetical protein